MSNKYNPITEEIETSACSTATTTSDPTQWTPLTTFICGKITDLDGDYDNMIDACTLPADTERQTIDLGELSELCN